MADKPVVVVFGATGSQGGGVADVLLKQGKFKVRAVTRNPSSDKAKALADRGAELVKADLDDKASLVKAFEGAYGTFVVTDFYGGAGGDADKEVQQGKNVVDAAKQAGIKHFVWSGLEDVRKFPGVRDKLPEVSPGRLVAHFESKGEITEYLKGSGVPFTVLHTSMFYENWIGFVPFVKQDDGHAFFLNLGTDKGHAAQAVHDIGEATAVVLADPEKYLGKTKVGAAALVGEHINMNDVADTISRVTGKPLKYINVPDEAAAQAGYPGAEDVANMFHFYREFSYFNDARPLDKAVFRGQSFADWAEDNKEGLAASFK